MTRLVEWTPTREVLASKFASNVVDRDFEASGNQVRSVEVDGVL